MATQDAGTIVDPSPFEATDPRVGMTLLDGRFEITAFIARGGMGAVYRATNREVGNEVAVKVLDTSQVYADPQELERRFESELDTLAELRDVRIPKVIARGAMETGELFMVTELLIGQTLEDEIAERGALGSERTIRIMQEVCLALIEAHARAIIHRDIKPANLFVQRIEGGLEQLRVLDFGIAKVTREGRNMTSTAEDGRTATIGTYQYMSPEQASGIAVVPQSDLYSLGVVAYHCLAGHPLFVGDPMLLMEAHRSTVPPPFSAVAPDAEIDPRLAALVFELLAKSPEDRPESAQRVYEILRAIERSERDTVERRPRRAAWTLAAAAIAAIAVGAFVQKGAEVSEGEVRCAPSEPGCFADVAIAAAKAGRCDEATSGIAAFDSACAGTCAQARAFDAGRIAIAIGCPAATQVAATGRLELSTRPDDAQVLVAGEPIDGAVELAPGTYVAVVRRPGFAEREVRFDVRPWSITQLQVTLLPDSADDRWVRYDDASRDAADFESLRAALERCVDATRSVYIALAPGETPRFEPHDPCLERAMRSRTYAGPTELVRAVVEVR